MTRLNLIQFEGLPIFEQLRLEEALLRTDEENWCLINHGSAPAIVMGISGKPEELIEPENHLPVIKRYSGGGTVVVSEETLFVSFIFNGNAHDFALFPEPIMRWSIDIYQKAWAIPGLALRENDYVIGEKKCGGNAQYIKKKRWVHHTTFLWKYDPSHMQLLKMPGKRPQYRGARNHEEFLTPLHPHFSEMKTMSAQIEKELAARYQLSVKGSEEMAPFLERPYRCATVRLA